VAVAAAGLVLTAAAAACGDDGPASGAASSGELSQAAQPTAREVELTTEDGLRLGATYVETGDPEDVVTVLVAHGNGGSRAERRPLADALAARGMSVLLLEYRGYGGNPGRPTEPGLARDATAGYRFLVDAGVPPGRLIYFGESLGTGVVAELARRHPPAGVVLRSPFTAYADIGADAYYPDGEVKIAKGDTFNTAEHVAALDVPVTVVWGDLDWLVPAQQSRAVADRAKRLVAAVVVKGADHNDQVFLDGAQTIDAVVALAEQVVKD
jgi:fermentation-respiration switch protein FrsA (DUF1100 family)